MHYKIKIIFLMSSLFVDLGQVYLKCAIKIPIQNIIEKEEGLNYFNNNEKIDYEDYFEYDEELLKKKQSHSFENRVESAKYLKLLCEKQNFNCEFEYIEPKLCFKLDKNFIVMFKFQNTKTLEFTRSDENNKFISPMIEKIPNLNYSGQLDETADKILKLAFANKDFIKSVKSTNLSIIGLDYLQNLTNSGKIRNPFFILPDIHLRKLSTIGKVTKITASDKIYYKNESLYPFTMANIVEGSSIYRVNSVTEYERLGGSSFGATTYWSLVKLLCNYDSPYEAVIDGINGDTSSIDLSVGDIYGGPYEKFNLPEDLIASSFGKIRKIKDTSELKKCDISRALLNLFCLCNGQIITLLSMNEKISKVFMVGNPFEALEFMQLLQMTVNYSSNKTVEMIFSDYNSYLSILGMISLEE